MAIKSINQVKYRRLLFSVSDTFLSAEDDETAGISYFIQSPVNVGNALSEFHTLLINLNTPEDIIWQNISRNARSEVNSFINNQAFDHRVLFNMSPSELNSFIVLFNRFARFKNIRKVETFRLRAYNKAGVLAVSYLKQGNHFLCVNFYRVTNQRATNLYSFNLKHELNGAYTQTHIGRAHRALHWLDILKFKAETINYYDFCGWYQGNTDSALLNINKFKEQFTSHKVIEYSGVIYRNRLLVFLLKLLRRGN